MYTLTKPFTDYANAQFETFSRFMQENQSRFPQPEALSQLIKTNIENYSRFVQECMHGFAMLAFETQGQMSRGVEETARGFQQAAKTTGIIVGETVETMNDTMGDTSGETNIANARSAARRRG